MRELSNNIIVLTPASDSASERVIPKMGTIQSLLLSLLILLLVIAALVGYYWAHKPIDAGQLLLLGGAALDLITVGALFTVGGGIGQAVLTRFFPTTLTLHQAERMALTALLGLTPIALVALACGLAGVFVGREFWIGLLLVAGLLRRSVLAWLRDGVALVRAARPRSALETAMIAAIAVLLITALLYTFAPPTRWDSLAYHLVGVANTLRDGRMLAEPNNFYLGFPENVEMLFRVAMSLFGRDTATALVHYGFGVLALLATAGLARRIVGRAGGWLAVLLIMSAYDVWNLFRWAYVDLAVMTCGALVFSAAVAWREGLRAEERRDEGRRLDEGRRAFMPTLQGEREWLILLGLLCGIAAGVKYTGGLLALSIVCVIVFVPEVGERGSLVRRVGRVAWVGGAALLVFSPWMLKGILLYGNPVYPFVFGGLGWNAARAAAFTPTFRNLISEGNAWHIPILPLTATLFGAYNSNGYGFTLGPFLLTGWVVLPFAWRMLLPAARQTVSIGGLLIVPLWIVWAALASISIVGQQTRLMIMLLPMFGILTTISLCNLFALPRKPIYIGFIVGAVVALTTALNVVQVLSSTERERPLGYLLATVSVEEFQYTQFGAYGNAMRALSTRPPQSRVQLVWEPRGYSCPPDIFCAADTALDYWVQSELQRGDAANEAEWIAEMRAHADYWLVWHSGYDAFISDDARRDPERRFPAFLEQHMTPVWTDGVRYTVYGWR